MKSDHACWGGMAAMVWCLGGLFYCGLFDHFETTKELAFWGGR